MQTRCRGLLYKLQALKDEAYQVAVAPMTLQVQREDAAKPPGEAEGGLMNPENLADPQYFQDETEVQEM